MKKPQGMLPLVVVCTVLTLAATGCASGETEAPAAESAQVQTERVVEPAQEEAGDTVKAQLTYIQGDEQKTMEVNYLPPGRKIATMETTKGTITIELWESIAPNTVINFVHLANSGRYDGVEFHRVIGGFMAQGGDVSHEKGRGGPGYDIPDEFDADVHHVRGVISMAHAAAPNSGGSQFFICYTDVTHLDGKYAAFGRVIEGMKAVDALEKAPKGSPSGVVESPDKIITVRVASVDETETEAAAE